MVVVVVVIILITILLISIIIIYANVFILYLTNVFLYNAFIFLLDFYWYFNWTRIYWCTSKRRGWTWWWSSKRYIFKFLDWCFKQSLHWCERKSTICLPWFVQEEMRSNWKNTRYFPTTISKSFVQYCFYGDVSNTELLSSF